MRLFGSLAPKVSCGVRALLNGLTLGSVLLLATAASAAPPKMGVYLSHGDEAQIQRYETWTNQSMAPIVDFLPEDNWEALTGVTAGYGTAWATEQWTAGYRDRILWTVGMLPRSGNITTNGGRTIVATRPAPTLAAGAAGEYDQQWRNLANTLVNKGYGNATIRLGWEFNGNWYPWRTNNATDAANYKAYWKRIVIAMQDPSGANFKFNWCGANGDQPSGINPSLAYPDADANGNYVDEIGVDVYDTSWAYYPIDPTWPQWHKDVNRTDAWRARSQWGTYNLNWWAAFASSKGKPLTIPEWGLADGPATIHGGGDNSFFIQRMHEWLMDPAHGVSWHAYFQANTSFQSQIFEDTAPANFPEATITFLNLFSGRPIVPIFQNTTNLINYVGGYGTRSATVVGTDGTGNAPFEGLNQYKVTYTSSAGVQLAFPAGDVSTATHLRLAIKGPVANSTQYVRLRLTASDGTTGAIITLPRTTAYQAINVPLTSLASGVTLSKVNSIYLYPQPNSPVGVSDLFYLDNVVFIKNTP